MAKHRFNEMRVIQSEEPGYKGEITELHFINDFAKIQEIKGLEKDNEPMLRVWGGCATGLTLQVRTFAPTTPTLSRKPGKPKNMMATVSIGMKDLEAIMLYARTHNIK